MWSRSSTGWHSGSPAKIKNWDGPKFALWNIGHLDHQVLFFLRCFIQPCGLWQSLSSSISGSGALKSSDVCYFFRRPKVRNQVRWWTSLINWSQHIELNFEAEIAIMRTIYFENVGRWEGLLQLGQPVSNRSLLDGLLRISPLTTLVKAAFRMSVRLCAHMFNPNRLSTFHSGSARSI